MWAGIREIWAHKNSRHLREKNNDMETSGYIYIPSRRCSGRYGMHGPFVVDLPIPRYMVVLVYQRVSNKKV